MLFEKSWNLFQICNYFYNTKMTVPVKKLYISKQSEQIVQSPLFHCPPIRHHRIFSLGGRGARGVKKQKVFRKFVVDVLITVKKPLKLLKKNWTQIFFFCSRILFFFEKFSDFFRKLSGRRGEWSKTLLYCTSPMITYAPALITFRFHSLSFCPYIAMFTFIGLMSTF